MTGESATQGADLPPMTPDVEQAGGAENMFRAIFQLSSDAIGVSRNGRHVLVNGAYLRLFGYAEAAELLNRPILDLIHPSEHAAILERVRTRTSGLETDRSYETVALRKDGTSFAMGVAASAYRVGDVVFTLVILRDVSDQKRRQQEAEERRAFYQATFDEYPLPKFLMDAETGVIFQANEAALRFYGYPPEVFQGKPITDINVAPADAIRDAMDQALAGTRRVFRFQHRVASGELRDVDVYTRPMVWKGRTYLLSSIIDVTENLRVEAQLRQSQKMEAVGQLAGAIAHDFNNLLTTIMGFASLARDEVPARGTTWRHLDEVLRTGKRAGDLTRQLLAFSRRQMLQPQVLNLNQLLMDTEVLLRHAVGERVALTWDLDPDAGNVCADPVQLQQVIMNLVVNARDAMPGGGRLRVGTARVPACTLLSQPAEAVVLSVADTGVGMTEETRARVFEPFFTTKEHGTGLGLPTVYGIVHQSGGAITVESEPGKGSTFRVALPRVEGAPVEVTASPVAGVPGVGIAGARVLVVEDQVTVRTFVARALASRRCVVEQAADGEQALDMLARGEFDLVITDVIMPGISGVEVLQRIRERLPNLPVLVMSGDPAGHGLDLASDRAVDFLAKPFTIHALVDALERLLRAARAA